MSEFIMYAGRIFHQPCADLSRFPFRGQMYPSTIMTGESRVWTCPLCGKMVEEAADMEWVREEEARDDARA